jgi:hypothetical protein
MTIWRFGVAEKFVKANKKKPTEASCRGQGTGYERM